MNLKRLSAATATGVLTLGLALGAPATANAAVKAGDVPSKGDIVKIFPELKGGEFTNVKAKKLEVPTAKCGTTKKISVKSSYSTAGNAVSEARITVIGSGVAEFKSVAAAKSYFKAQKAMVKKCKSFTAHGVKVTLKSVKAPAVGQERLATAETYSLMGGKSYGASVVIRHGKRVAVISVGDSKKPSSAKMNKIAKVAAKKMK
ncbi:hypothetical protein ACLM5J_03810 [Nocardioides sp. Bht2]|uniref:hypothetical protein n=1 Tax=Nocardioides sp. Bht2 TaxID=3392297 RepID=UPI0039B3FFFD